MEIFINPLSAHGQFSDTNDAERAMEDLLKCFEQARAGIEAGTIALVYDENMERRGLRPGSVVLKACLAALIPPDKRVRWYFYTRRARIATPDFEEVSLEGDGETITGEVSEDLRAAKLLASFGGSPACRADRVQLSIGGKLVNACASFYDWSRFQRFLPRYQSNPKHGVVAYTRARGEAVAPMTVDDVAAQAALLAAIDDGDGHRYGLFEGKFLKFVVTSGITFHAYEVAAGEVPASILKTLLQR